MEDKIFLSFINKFYPKKSIPVLIEPNSYIFDIKKAILPHFSKRIKNAITDLRLVRAGPPSDDEDDTLEDNYFEEKYNESDAFEIFRNYDDYHKKYIYFRAVKLEIKVEIITKDMRDFISFPLAYENNNIERLIEYIEKDKKIKIDSPYHLFLNTKNLEQISTEEDIKKHYKTGLILFNFPIKAKFINMANNYKTNILLKFDKPIKDYLRESISKKIKIISMNFAVKIKNNDELVDVDINAPVHEILKKQHDEPVIFEIHNTSKKIVIEDKRRMYLVAQQRISFEYSNDKMTIAELKTELKNYLNIQDEDIKFICDDDNKTIKNYCDENRSNYINLEYELIDNAQIERYFIIKGKKILKKILIRMGVFAVIKNIADEYDIDRSLITLYVDNTFIDPHSHFTDYYIPPNKSIYVDFEEKEKEETGGKINTKLEEKIKQFEDILSLPHSKSKDTSKGEEMLSFIDSDEELEFLSDPVKIGEGSTFIAYKVFDSRTKSPMCKKVLKCTSKITMKNAQNAMKEFEILRKISHPCICKAININIGEKIEIKDEDGDQLESTTIALFLEFVDYKLSDILKKEDISNTSKVRIVLDIVHAMNFLHKHGMIHRNLTIENIMLNAFFNTKLVNFGLAKVSESIDNDTNILNESMTKKVGSLEYMSPEMAREEEYDNKVDVYSFGKILHIIFTGELPKQSLNDKIKGKKINLPIPSISISKFCIELIDQCLSPKPSKRPSFEDILNMMRTNSYELAPDIDSLILSQRDKELDFFENYK